MTITRLEDAFGDPVELNQSWEFSGVRARTDAEKEVLAIDALEAKCKQLVLERKAAGKDITFDHTQLIRIDNEWSDTNADWMGVRTTRCGGIAVGYLFYS